MTMEISVRERGFHVRVDTALGIAHISKMQRKKRKQQFLFDLL